MGASVSNKKMDALNTGKASTANLTEWLSVDQKCLLEAVAKVLGLNQLTEMAERLPKASAPKQIAWIGAQLSSVSGSEVTRTHPSDIVRCWGCYADSAKARDLEAALLAVKPFAKDEHFGVREIAWMAIRNKICEDPRYAIQLLIPWAKSRSEYLRRFASEATRPRGVWAKHIDELKKDPTPALPILNLLQADVSRYVQNSVANWLNDASKTSPLWVKKLCAAWLKNSETAATIYIVKRAQRSM